MEKKIFKGLGRIARMAFLAGILIMCASFWESPAASAEKSVSVKRGKSAERDGGRWQGQRMVQKECGADQEGQEENQETPDGLNETEMEEPVLMAASRPDGRILLCWDEIDGGEEYVLYRSEKKSGGFRRIYKTDGEKCRYTDRKRIPGKAYYYRLKVYCGEYGAYSSSETVKGRSLNKVRLRRISNLSGSRKLVLRWKRVKGADRYQILRKNEAKGRYQVIATVKGTKNSYTDKRRRGGKFYTYKVRARDDAGGRGGESSAASQMAIDGRRKMIALTYDDGPSPHTPIVLRALKKYKAQATFFVVGGSVGRYPGSVRRAAALGCEIGNHTYSHNKLTRLSPRQVKSVLNQTNRVVRAQIGRDIRIMRPPGGSINPAVCKAAGMPVILWSIDTLDWKTRSTSATIRCVLQRARDGDVVLMHDLHLPTARAADSIIRTLKARGYQLVTVTELAAYRGGMSPGKTYSRFTR